MDRTGNELHTFFCNRTMAKGTWLPLADCPVSVRDAWNDLADMWNADVEHGINKFVEKDKKKKVLLKEAPVKKKKR